MPACAPPGNDSKRRDSGIPDCAEAWPQSWSVTDALTSIERQSRALALALSRGDDEAYEEAERVATTLALLRSPVRLSLQKLEDSTEKCSSSSNVKNVEEAESEEMKTGHSLALKVPPSSVQHVEKAESEEMKMGRSITLKVPFSVQNVEKAESEEMEMCRSPTLKVPTSVQNVGKAASEEMKLGRSPALKVPGVEDAKSEVMESGTTQALKVASGPESKAEASNTAPSADPDTDAAAPEGKNASDRDQKSFAKSERLLLPRHVSIESSTTDKDATAVEKFPLRSEAAARQHAVGAHVEYYSQTAGHWIDAKVQGFDEVSGCYDLDVHPVAPPQKVRAKPPSKGNLLADGKHEVRNSPLLGSCVQHQQPATSSSCEARERISEGSAAEYWSTTFGGWIPAVVKGFTEETGTYVLDIQPVAVPHKVRAAASLQARGSSPRAPGDGIPESLQARATTNSCTGGSLGSADECRCGLCQTSFDVEKLVFLQCEHFFCLPCLQNHVLSLDFVRQRVPCPGGDCSEFLALPQIKEVVGAEAFSKRHEKMLHEDEELARQLAIEDGSFNRPLLTERTPKTESGQPRFPSIRPSPEVAVTQLAQVAPVPRPKAKASEHARRMSNLDEEAAKALQEELAKEDASGPSERQFDCPLCLLTHNREEGIELDCQHRLCATCFHAYLQSKITDAQVAEDELVCPIPNCKTEITTAQVEGGTHGTDLWDKFLTFRMKMWKPDQEDGIIVECPTRQCGRFVVPDGLEKVRCPVCAKEFCPKCMENHSGSTCQAFQAWKAENSKADQTFEELMAHEHWRRCPKCGAPSERESGCNFMQCRSAICRKHTYWCYVCGKELAKQDHYSHYPKGPYEDLCNTPEAERHVPALPPSWEGGGTFTAAVEVVAAVGDAFRGLFKAPVGAA